METIFSYLAEHFDLPILDWIRSTVACPALDLLMPKLTLLGDAGMVWIMLAALLLLRPKHRRAGITVAAALILGLVVCNLCMKPLFARIRPYDYQLLRFGKEIPLLIQAERDFSFPSGHTIASFEAATALWLYNKKWGTWAMVLAVLIAFSRLYLYVHYPTDVICSVILGMGIGLLSFQLVNRLPKPKPL